MRTPAGKECRFYYADHYRGSEKQECRLIERNPEGGRWRPSHCNTCPVPDILRANACEHMTLIPRLERSFPFVKQQVKVQTYCDLSQRSGFDPHVGCGQCHPLPSAFIGEDRP